MAERINRREQIIDTAGRLFVEQGYTSTSVRQITDEVGCTEAALYYHFKDGKRELLQEVIGCHTPHLEEVIKACQRADSLPEMVRNYEKAFQKHGEETLNKARWLLADFHRLSPEERQIVQGKWLHLQEELACVIARFVDDPERVTQLAWLMVLTTFGYGMLFFNFDLRSEVDYPASNLSDLLVGLLANE